MSSLPASGVVLGVLLLAACDFAGGDFRGGLSPDVLQRGTWSMSPAGGWPEGWDASRLEGYRLPVMPQEEMVTVTTAVRKKLDDPFFHPDFVNLDKEDATSTHAGVRLCEEDGPLEREASIDVRSPWNFVLTLRYTETPTCMPREQVIEYSFEEACDEPCKFSNAEAALAPDFRCVCEE